MRGWPGTGNLETGDLENRISIMGLSTPTQEESQENEYCDVRCGGWLATGAAVTRTSFLFVFSLRKQNRTLSQRWLLPLRSIRHGT